MAMDSCVAGLEFGSCRDIHEGPKSEATSLIAHVFKMQTVMSCRTVVSAF